MKNSFESKKEVQKGKMQTNNKEKQKQQKKAMTKVVKVKETLDKNLKAYEFNFPKDRRYLKNHAWIKIEKNKAIIGITELGQSLAKEIVHIDLPEKGDKIKEEEPIISFETIKSVNQISLPFDVKVLKVNEKLWENPNLLNENPYNVWILEIEGKIDNKKLLNVKKAIEFYKKLIKKERERFEGY